MKPDQDAFAPQTEAQVVLRIAQGDRRAFELLYDRYSPWVYGLALHVLQSAPAAEALTEEVFLWLWQSADTYQPDQGKVSSWLLEQARQRLAQSRWQMVGSDAEAPPWEEGKKSAERDEAQAGGKVDENWPSPRHFSALHALQALPALHQSALKLASIERCSLQEIASRLNESPESIRQALGEGMQALKALWRAPT